MANSTQTKPDKRVCTCDDGYLCPFVCEDCEHFREPEETDRKEKSNETN